MTIVSIVVTFAALVASGFLALRYRQANEPGTPLERQEHRGLDEGMAAAGPELKF